MKPRIISLSAAPYDGHPIPRMLDSMATCGATHVEPAFIVGYTEPFDESSFSPAQARSWVSWLAEAGLACDAMSSHIDLGRDDAVEVFRGRMDFARALGARVINTNAASSSRRRQFFANIQKLARHAESIGLQIGLENPGDGSENVFNTAVDGLRMLAEIDHQFVGLNYDAGNTVSHRPDVAPVADALSAMDKCIHTHIKDVRKTSDGYVFTDLGAGQVGCADILRGVAATTLNLSIEIPMRLRRANNAQPVRAAQPIPIVQIENRLRPALAFVHQHVELIGNTH